MHFRLNRWSIICVPPILWAAAFVCGLTVNAHSQDLRVGNDSNYIEIYGQINKGFLFYDDGTETKFYPLVDNDSSSTRFGARAHREFDNGLIFGANVEFQWKPYSTTTVNQTTDHDIDYDNISLRKGEVYFSRGDFGKIWAGHGSMASDNTSSSDLSGTGLAANVSVVDIAGGQFFRDNNDLITNVRVNNVYSDLDGLGRRNRVRFDTARFNGLAFQTSVDIDGNWDVAANYTQELGAFEVAAAAAYSEFHDTNIDTVNGSVSVLHDPTGLSVTFVAGRRDLSNRTPQFVYGKLGYQADWFQYGRTYFSVDAYSGHDFRSSGSRSRSYGVAMVQDFADLNTEVFLGLRTYQFDEVGTSYQDGHAIIFGSRFRF